MFDLYRAEDHINGQEAYLNLIKMKDIEKPKNYLLYYTSYPTRHF